MRWIGFAVLSFVLAGCAGMSKQECLHADWRGIGYEDGAKGKTVAALSSRRQTCAKRANIAVDSNAYLEGREAGLVEFCRPASGFAFGSRGGWYQGVCRGPSEAAFTSAYQKGRHLYGLNQAASRATRNLNAAERQLADVVHRIAHTEAVLVALNTLPADRVNAAVDLKHLYEEKARVETSIDSLTYDHESTHSELVAYKATLAAEGVYSSSPQRTSAHWPTAK